MNARLVRTLFAIACFGGPLAMRPGPAGAGRPSNVPGAEPYRAFVSVTVPNGFGGHDQIAADPVPADRRLVIENVAIGAFVPLGQKPPAAGNGVVHLGIAGRPYPGR